MTPPPVSDLSGMLAGMAPVLDAHEWRFVMVAVLRELAGQAAAP